MSLESAPPLSHGLDFALLKQAIETRAAVVGMVAGRYPALKTTSPEMHASSAQGGGR